MNRISAFLLHLGISLVIFTVLGYLIVFHWYPDFFFQTDGGWQGIRIIALVDLVLGPTLTLIVFKAGKPGLKFDLSAIATLQSVCLVAGTYIVYSERPLAIVYADGFFHSVSADDFRKIGSATPDLSHFPGENPKWLTVGLPEDYASISEVRMKAYSEGIPMRMLINHYKPFEGSDIDPERDPFPLETLESEQPDELEQFLREFGGRADDYYYFPLGARHGYALIALRTSDLQVVGVVSLPG